MNKEITKKYNNGEVTVLWKPNKCIHSAICVGGLPEVFQPKEKPWIKIDGATSEKIINQVQQCPSGALSMMSKQDEPKELKSSTPIAAGSSPMLVDVENGKTYAWCACGLSTNQPWCDGSHKVTSITPVVFKVNGYTKATMCLCKQSGTKPFCDDSHLKI
jgi:uncharacterized Fe-S cluster protein YjdI/CDGSH-type Zn-finger protein